MTTARSFAVAAAGIAWAGTCFAGGGGQNMLIVVNPNDESSLRIANAYARLRNIPDSNFLFITPPNITGTDAPRMDITNSLFRSNYVTPISQQITARGLDGQIDYITTLGQPMNVGEQTSLAFGLSHITQLVNDPARTTINLGYQTGSTRVVDEVTGVITYLYEAQQSVLFQGRNYDFEAPYVRGTNAAIHHSTVYTQKSLYGAVYDRNAPPGTPYMQYAQIPMQFYMSGVLAYTGMQGSTAAQAIASLEHTVAGDGTNPQGTIYLNVDTNNIRSGTRQDEYPELRKELDARGIPWENFTSNQTGGANTPKDKPAVRGVITGSSTVRLPNGSTYIPGSFADHLTSAAMMWNYASQDKATEWVAAGAAGSAGTVNEPYTVWQRFPHAYLHVFSADGSTLGEAYTKSIAGPGMSVFVGDMLSQAWADVPVVAIGQGPAQGQTVSGTFALGASASLNLRPDSIATGVAKLELYVDGKLAQTALGDAGNFNIDTSQLSDGQHELRVVAINDTAAESQGYLVREIVVNNQGRAVQSGVAALNLAAKEVAAVPLNALAGNGQAQRIELRHLGRVLGTVNGADGAVNVDAATLAYGENRLVPVAVYADGSEVRGQTILVNRDTPALLAGKTPAPVEKRIEGVKAEYFLQGAADKVADMNFSGAPVMTHYYNDNSFTSWNTNRWKYAPARAMDEHFQPITLSSNSDAQVGDRILEGYGGSPLNLGLRLSGRFIVPDGNAGQYDFNAYQSASAWRLSVDGQEVFTYDAGRFNVETVMGSIFLDSGEHQFTVDIGTILPDFYHNKQYLADDNLITTPYLRGPDGVTYMLFGWDGQQYQPHGLSYVLVPEPAGLGLLLGGAALLAGRRRRIIAGTYC